MSFYNPSFLLAAWRHCMPRARTEIQISAGFTIVASAASKFRSTGWRLPEARRAGGGDLAVKALTVWLRPSSLPCHESSCLFVARPNQPEPVELVCTASPTANAASAAARCRSPFEPKHRPWPAPDSAVVPPYLAVSPWFSVAARRTTQSVHPPSPPILARLAGMSLCTEKRRQRAKYVSWCR